MFNHKKIKLNITAFVLMLMFSSACSSPVETKDLNVVFILSDAMRAASMPLYGYGRDTTPNIQKLASNGIVFERHFSNAPATRVSISQLFTGRLLAPMMMGTEHSDPLEFELPDNLLQMHEAFRAANYETSIISAHVWFNHSARIMNGFTQRQIIDPPKGTRRPSAHYEELAPSIMQTMDKLEKGDKPFFLYIHSMDTHTPFTYHKGFDKWKKAKGWRKSYNIYDSEILYTDHWVGKIIERIDQSSLKENTIVVFTSDHGEEFNEMGPGPWNNTHGANLRRASTHVPFILRMPPGRAIVGKYSNVTQHIDVAPTLLKLASKKIDLSQKSFDGADLSKIITAGDFDATLNGSAIAQNSRYFTGRFNDNPDLDVELDKWSGETSIYEIKPDKFNYPRPVLNKKFKNSHPLSKRLNNTHKKLRTNYETMPKIKRKPSSGNAGITGRFIPVKGGRGPVYPDKKRDNRWHFNRGKKLSCAPEENPGPITIKMHRVPGKYRVALLLDKNAIRKQGYKNEFEIIVEASKSKTIKVSQETHSNASTIPLGEFEIKNGLLISVKNPSGGVAISGFNFKYLGDEAPTISAPPVDPAITERLRALGYIE